MLRHLNAIAHARSGSFRLGARPPASTARGFACHATRAALLRRLGRSQESRAAYDKAIECIS
jgi:predicted RNA polymerase sigma factor